MNLLVKIGDDFIPVRLIICDDQGQVERITLIGDIILFGEAARQAELCIQYPTPIKTP